MDTVRLKNFRCFRDEQVVRLAPLVLLVGENSTGKTSFLALIRALWDAAYLNTIPDFKEAPYDLGSFDEVAHYRGGRAGRAEGLEAGMLVGQNPQSPYRVDVTFGRKGTFPVPVRWRLARGDVWIEERIEGDLSRRFTTGRRTANGGGRCRREIPSSLAFATEYWDLRHLSP